MLQSVFRPISNHLTTNWPILWAARLDVALGCALLLCVADIPIFWLGPGVWQQKWEATDIGSMLAFVAWVMDLGAIIVWVISVGRVYIRGMSPRMSQHPRFIDIFLGTIIIVTPSMIVLPFAAFHVEMQQTGLPPLGWAGLIIGCVALAIIFSFIVIAILRSSMRMALLSLIGVAMAVGFVQSTITSAIAHWSTTPPDKAVAATTSATVEFFTAMSMVAFLVWVLSGTTRLHIRQRLATILFPALFPFASSIHDSALQLLGLAARADNGNIDYFATYSNPQVALVYAPLFLVLTIILGEALSRRWARLTLMPK